MATTPVKIQDIDEVLAQSQAAFTKLYKVAAPYTTVVKRALVTDFSKDCMPKFGIDRIMTQAIEEVQGESGPNGERVFKPINDVHDQIRFVGGWISTNDASGTRAQTGANTIDFVEITFYGTGLNVLILVDSGARNFIASVDGGSVSGNLYPTTASSVINGRYYSQNQVINVASGLTLGIHTIKIQNNTASFGLHLYGFEVLNTASTLQLVPGSSYLGGKKLSKAALSTDAYNSNFESGTLGTKGGHVVVYQKSDGSIGKAVQPTDASQLNLASASHANESVIRSYSWREFGAGRNAAAGTPDDFSLGWTTTSNRAFTLDDGTTTLAGFSVSNLTSVGGFDAVFSTSVGATVTITFVGTGLDVLVDRYSDGASAAIAATVDGGSSNTSATFSTPTLLKIVSGLPYGTHTVKMAVAGSASSGFIRFVVYGPSKPAVPAGAVELADYYVMATYSTTSTTAGFSTGVLVKAPSRELVYAGANWSTGITNGLMGIYTFNTSTSADVDFFQYTFFGTGIELTLGSGSLNVTGTLTVDGVSPSTGVTVLGGGSYSNPILTWTSVSLGNVVAITGLALGLHTVKLSKHSTTDQMQVFNLNIITPVHSPKSNTPGDLQSTLSVGSCALGDSRKFSGQMVKTLPNWSQAVGVVSDPTTTVTTFVPMPNMACVVKTLGNPIQINWNSSVYNSLSGPGNNFQIYVDGIGYSIKSFQGSTNTYDATVGDNLIVPVAAGVHTVQIFWKTSAGTLTAESTWRNLTVKEL